MGERNRVRKVLEQANVKLGSVLSECVRCEWTTQPGVPQSRRELDNEAADDYLR
jgi:hypothetical protein